MRNERTTRRWRVAWWTALVIGLVATLVGIFYAEEDWRGLRAWEKCKRELEVRGANLDWNTHIPGAVPVEQNIFKAPKMAEWFVGRGENDLSRRLYNPDTGSISTTNTITTAAAAAKYLEWSDQFELDFTLIRNGLGRPVARIDNSYERPFDLRAPNFISIRRLAQTLAQRAHCYILLGQPEKALGELTFLNDMRRLVQGKPATLIAAMMNVAITGLYVDVIAEGLEMHAWRKEQLIALERQLKEIDLLSLVVAGFDLERIIASHAFEMSGADDFISRSAGPTIQERIKDPVFLFCTFGPRGWIYQNIAIETKLVQNIIDCYDLTNGLVSPGKAEAADNDLQRTLSRFSPYVFLARIAAPRTIRTTQSVAHRQMLVNEAQIACELERYRLAHGEYPETLDALVPEFADKLPHDIINGLPLRYRRNGDGQFLLYSVGWNETDDGGLVERQDDYIDLFRGDWIWGRSTK